MLKNNHLIDHGETQDAVQKIVEMYGEYFSNIVSSAFIRKNILRRTCYRIQYSILLKHWSFACLLPFNKIMFFSCPIFVHLYTKFVLFVQKTRSSPCGKTVKRESQLLRTQICPDYTAVIISQLTTWCLRFACLMGWNSLSFDVWFSLTVWSLKRKIFSKLL